MKKILICGLPHSGKTTLARALMAELPNCVHLNGDDVRTLFDDWDFSPEARIRQAHRMVSLSRIHNNLANAICLFDFVCPTQETRDILDADVTIWVHRDGDNPYADTQAMFEPVTDADIVLTDGSVDEWVQTVIESGLVANPFHPSGLVIGRFQPFHDGHLYLVKTAIDMYGRATVAVRSTHGTSGKDPFDINFVMGEIRARLEQEGIADCVDVVPLPNIADVIYGRDVGYHITQIEAPEQITDISATGIRESPAHIVRTDDGLHLKTGPGTDEAVAHGTYRDMYTYLMEHKNEL